MPLPPSPIHDWLVDQYRRLPTREPSQLALRTGIPRARLLRILNLGGTPTLPEAEALAHAFGGWLVCEMRPGAAVRLAGRKNPPRNSAGAGGDIQP